MAAGQRRSSSHALQLRGQCQGQHSRVALVAATLLLVVFAAHCPHSADAQTACPARCQCVRDQANCTGRSLTAPPKSYPPGTRVIVLQGNHIRVLGSRTFHRQQAAEKLNLSQNKITALRNDAFLTFPSLMSMELTGNRIWRIFPRALAGLTHLQTLSLNRNRIRRLTGIFQGTPNLRQLNLASNRISRISENDLARLTRVHNLDLRDNRISVVHPRAFRHLESLRYLFLNKNPISTSLDLQFGSRVLQLVDISNCQLPTVPQTLPESLSDYRLGRNKIMQINHTDFQNISDLKMLALNDNELHFVADGTFTHLMDLKEIWLRGNNLVYVPRDIPANVEKLYMDSNRIREIESGIFPPNSQLGFFSAENNQLRRINPDTFAGLSLMTTINLQGNQLQSLEPRTFTNLPRLATLMLSNNPLQRLERGVFQNLPNLTSLHLSYLSPETTEVEDNFLSAVPRLHTLEVMASPGMGHAIVQLLERSSAGSLVVLPALIRLDLSYNNLRWVSPRLREVAPSARTVLLDGNPFHCDQRLRWLPRWMAATNITFHQSEQLTCHTPESLRGRPLTSLDDHEWAQVGGDQSESESRNRDPSRRQRQKRHHDQASFNDIHSPDDSRKTRHGDTQTRMTSNQNPGGRKEEDSVDAASSRTRASPGGIANAQRSPSPSPSLSQRRQQQQQVERALAVRAQREERRSRRLKNRSRSRSRKGGKRRGKATGGRRRRRKGRKNNKQRGGKRNKEVKKNGDKRVKRSVDED